MLTDANTTAKNRIMVDTGSLRDLYTTWYLSTDSSIEVPYNETTYRPLTTGQAVDNIANLAKSRQLHIETMSNASIATSVVTILCYSVPNGLLILDGNHRICSIIARETAHPRVFAIILCGPIDADILPDLQHWIELN